MTAMTNQVSWHVCRDEMPDDETTVLVAFRDDGSGEPVWIGYHDAQTDGWYSTDNMRFADEVTHWAELPEGPNDGAMHELQRTD